MHQIIKLKFKRYYVAQLYCALDSNNRLNYVIIPGEYGTKEEAYAAAERKYHEYDWIDPQGQIWNPMEIEILPQLKAV